MSDQFITYELDGPIAVIGINRPDKRNAISTEVMSQLRTAVVRAGEEADVGVIFGHGDHFSAGLDLAEIAKRISAGAPPPKKRYRRPSHDTLDIVARGPIPFVVALKGAVVGLGLEIAAAAHIRVADETTFFGLPEARRGIFVGGGGSVRIQRIIGYSRMCDMMLTARMMAVDEAERIGLARYRVAPGEALPKAKEIALKIAANAPAANWAITNILPRMGDIDHNDALMMEELTTDVITSRGSIEQLNDFVEKRAAPLEVPKKGR